MPLSKMSKRQERTDQNDIKRYKIVLEGRKPVQFVGTLADAQARAKDLKGRLA